MNEEIVELAEEPLTDEELAMLLEQRSNSLAFLSRLYLREVDETLLDELHDMLYPAETEDEKLDKGYRLFATYLSNLWAESLTELSIDYAKCFLGNSVDAFGAAYPYESVYTSEKRLMMQAARDEVLAIYRSCGFTKREDWTEGEDHLALELEFVRALNDRALAALNSGSYDEFTRLMTTQRNFMEFHVVGWVPMMTADLKRFAQTKFYQGLAYITEGFLRTDFAFLQDLLNDDK